MSNGFIRICAAAWQIGQRAEDFLRARNELSPARLSAFNQARFETTSSAWHQERRERLAIIETIRRSQPGFIPAGDAAPRVYRMVFRALGFRLAETIADLRRRFLPAPQAA